MKAPIFKRKWTSLSTFIFCLGFVAITLLFYFIYKRGTLCSVFKNPNQEEQAANQPSQIIEHLWLLWTRLVLFFNTSKLGSVEIDKKEEQAISNMCLYSHITTDALRIIFATHLPQDIVMVSGVCYDYFAEKLTKPKPLTLLFTAMAFIFLVNVFFVLMFICVRKIQRGRHSPNKLKTLCCNCAEEEPRHRAPPFESRTSFHAQLDKPQSFCALRWISKSLMLALSLSLMWEFIRLYQSKVAERASTIVKGIPADCDPHSMSILDSVKEFLRHHFSWTHGLDACNDYYYALLVDPLWEVSPLMVFSSVFSRCLLYPLELTCSSLGRGIRFFFLEIPSQWQPLILVVVVLLSLLALLMLCGYRLHVPLLFKLEPVTPKRTTSPNRRKPNMLINPNKC